MTNADRYGLKLSLTVALGGFLMGFDASVISGVVSAIEDEFQLTKIQLGWSVASLTLAATFAMLISGSLSDRFGRRAVLRVAAASFAVSAILSAFAPTFEWLVIARMLGGFGVGAALIIAPIYIAEISPSEKRGKLVSLNQLNIVVGITAAFFSNYIILKLSLAEEGMIPAAEAWRWMLGFEAIPAVIYLVALVFVPESPRWLVRQGKSEDALKVLAKTCGHEVAVAELSAESHEQRSQSLFRSWRSLFTPALTLVLTIGVVIGIIQQLTGINAVFFYAPIIFELSGVATDTAFLQAVLVGVINLVFTLLAIRFIDSLGRRVLLLVGLTGISISMLLLSFSFGSATYKLNTNILQKLEAEQRALPEVVELSVKTYDSDVEFRRVISSALGEAFYKANESEIIKNAVDINAWLVITGILGFVAFFAMSLGPVMWVLFSEIFPNQLRAVAISFVGLINSATSFGVQLLFPWELENLGNSVTFLIYGVVAIVGLIFVAKYLPETKQKTLEQIEKELVPIST